MSRPQERPSAARPAGVAVIAVILLLEALACLGISVLFIRTLLTNDPVSVGGSVFLAEIAEHCLDPFSFGSCRIHVIKQVSS